MAWNIYDERLHQMGLGFPDYRAAVEAGAIHSGPDAPALAEAAGLPADALRKTIEEVRAYCAGGTPDPFGRDFTTKPALEAPFYAVRVTGALFHTQGGLVIDDAARVLLPDATALPNLYAGGGAACGVSGARVEGYLSGNGLLTAVALGAIAGRSAAAQVKGGA